MSLREFMQRGKRRRQTVDDDESSKSDDDLGIERARRPRRPLLKPQMRKPAPPPKRELDEPDDPIAKRGIGARRPAPIRKPRSRKREFEELEKLAEQMERMDVKRREAEPTPLHRQFATPIFPVQTVRPTIRAQDGYSYIVWPSVAESQYLVRHRVDTYPTSGDIEEVAEFLEQVAGERDLPKLSTGKRSLTIIPTKEVFISVGTDLAGTEDETTVWMVFSKTPGGIRLIGVGYLGNADQESLANAAKMALERALIEHGVERTVSIQKRLTGQDVMVTAVDGFAWPGTTLMTFGSEMWFLPYRILHPRAAIWRLDEADALVRIERRKVEDAEREAKGLRPIPLRQPIVPSASEIPD